MRTSTSSSLRDRSLRRYLGAGFLVVGTVAMVATGSMLPMALAASASLMMSAPLLRQRLLRLQRVRR